LFNVEYRFKVQVSDTTGVDSSNTVKIKNNLQNAVTNDAQ